MLIMTVCDVSHLQLLRPAPALIVQAIVNMYCDSRVCVDDHGCENIHRVTGHDLYVVVLVHPSGLDSATAIKTKRIRTRWKFST